MKKLLLLIITAALVIQLFETSILAQAPDGFKYQAVLYDKAGNLLANQNKVVIIDIIQGSGSGISVFTETHNVTTTSQGLINLNIGSINTPGMAAINWANGPYFIKITVDGIVFGTSQLLSVPYALYAKTSENGFSGNYNDLTNKPNGINPGDMQYWNGTNWVMIPVGQPGQFLQLSASNIPAWSGAVYPVISSVTVSSITSNKAISGGNISSDGGSAVTARGVCWSTKTNPTIADNKTINGAGTGTFVSSINGLTLGVTYYLRSYATNNLGTSYSDQITFTASTIPSVGDYYQGGIVAYILQPGDPGYIAGETHGIIAAPTDQSTSIQWYNGSNNLIGGTATTIGTGNANTSMITSNQGTGSYAAKLCSDLILNGYGGWYLPSKDELNILYQNRAAIGSFSLQYYWSSSEDDASHSWGQFFNGGSVGSQVKSANDYVRAVRSF
jgi:Protein of unknown function (DUF1566)